MELTPIVSNAATVMTESGYQSLQPVQRPLHWGVDKDLSRRPGIVKMRREPEPLPNTRFPPERQPGEPASPKHGRPNKPMPPVFGTSCPLRGLSGAIRRLAYMFPDHYPRHWLLKLLGDRVESAGHTARRYALMPITAPVAIAGSLFTRIGHFRLPPGLARRAQ